MRSPWTHEELAAMRSSLEASILETEAEEPNIRGLPPMTEDEVKGLVLALIATAEHRVLTHEEVFLHAQLLAQFGMAICAKMLGKNGRYFVLSEADVERASSLQREDA
jgi:hypothetical protein